MTAIRIFEVLYKAEQTLSEPVYSPLVIDNQRPEWRELQAYLHLYQHNVSHWQVEQFTGVFSPKFSQKARISSLDFLAFVQAHADYDVCMINPFPQIAYSAYNVWMQGEYAHPGITQVAQDLLTEVGLPWDLSQTPRQNNQVLAFANFWVAKTRFWHDYIGGVLLPIARFIEQQQQHSVVKKVFSATRHTDEASYLPFIIERLFSTYLSFHPHILVAAYPITYENIQQRYCLNDFERLIVEHMHLEVDEADNAPNAVFSGALRQKMQLVTALRQQHFFDYYVTRPHPHTGRSVTI